MTGTKKSDVNKVYIITVSIFTFLLPIAATVIEYSLYKEHPFSFAMLGKWFIFSAVGLRLTAAGIKQVKDPAFTARQIFNIETPEVLPIVRELGFANLCFGLVGILSLFFPQWRMVSAFASGIYYGIAGLQHWLKKPSGINEKFALITDIFIFVLLLIYFIANIV
jgi:hypothetical protein